MLKYAASLVVAAVFLSSQIPVALSLRGSPFSCGFLFGGIRSHRSSFLNQKVTRFLTLHSAASGNEAWLRSSYPPAPPFTRLPLILEAAPTSPATDPCLGRNTTPCCDAGSKTASFYTCKQNGVDPYNALLTRKVALCSSAAPRAQHFADSLLAPTPFSGLSTTLANTGVFDQRIFSSS